MDNFLRQSSFWLRRPDSFKGREVDSEEPQQGMPAPETSTLALGSGERTSSFLEDYVDEDGIDRRVGVGSSSEEDEFGGTHTKHWFSWRKLWLYTGPGFLMSIAYLDPGNLESDLQAGAQAGYMLCWVLMWSTLLGYAFQMLAAKLGVATGLHLAQHCREEYPPWPRYCLWIMTEIAIIGSDIQEVIGSAIAILLLTRGAIPLWAGVLITAVDSFLILLIERMGIRHLEAVFGVLIGTMAASFGMMAVLADVPPLQVLEGVLLPRLTRSALQPAVAIVGAVIMPHNIYLHSALVHSRKISARKVSKQQEAMAYFSIESGAALALSLLINICVVAVFARGFFGKGHAEIGLENAGHYLGQAFGGHMKYIWAIGLLAAGQSSTMTGTYTGQFVMGGFLDLHIKQWQRVAVTRSVAIVPTLLVALLYRQHSSNALDVLTEWLNVLQSIQLPFALIPVLSLTSNERIMGATFVNSPLQRTLCWTGAAAIMAVNVVLICESSKGVPHSFWAITPLVCGICAYVAFVSYLVIGPKRFAALYARLTGTEPPASSERQPLLRPEESHANGMH